MKTIAEELAAARALKPAEPKRAETTPLMSSPLLQQFASASAGMLYVVFSRTLIEIFLMLVRAERQVIALCQPVTTFLRLKKLLISK